MSLAAAHQTAGKDQHGTSEYDHDYRHDAAFSHTILLLLSPPLHHAGTCPELVEGTAPYDRQGVEVPAPVFLGRLII